MFTCDNCGQKVGRATVAEAHEFECETPDQSLCGKWCPSDHKPPCGHPRGHSGVCEGLYDAAMEARLNRERYGF